MGLFDGIFNRADRRQAAERYEETIAYLTAEASRNEVALAKQDARERAGEHLDERDKQEIDERLAQRLSIDEARSYGDVVATTPLDAVVDGSWRQRYAEAEAAHRSWMREEHQRDQHWQAAEAAMRRALDEGRVDDTTMRALDEYIAEIDPNGATTSSDGWYERFATARLAAGFVSRPRRTPRLIAQADETVAFTEEGSVIEVERFLDGGDRQRERMVVTPVQIDASDVRIAVFAEQLVFSSEWRSIVGVETGEDEQGPWVRLDDAELGVSHVVHTDMADLLAVVAREFVRRTS